MDALGVAVLGGDLAEVGRLAEHAEAAGFSSVWTTEFYERSAVVSLAVMAERTSRVRLGSGIAYGFARSPVVLAAEARDLDELSGGRLILGLGTGTRRMQQDWHGLDGVGPAPRMEELVPLLRRIWAMNRDGVDHDGPFYRLHLHPTAEVRRPHRTGIPVYLAGVNARMVAAAGAVGDGLVGHPLFTRQYVEEVVRPALAVGAGRAARQDIVPIAGYVICSIHDDVDRARRDARLQVAFYSVVRTYRAIIELGGFQEQAAAARSAWERRDLDAMAAAIDNRMLSAITVAAAPDEAYAQLMDRFGGLYDDLVCYAPSVGLADGELRDRLDAIVDTFGEKPGR